MKLLELAIRESVKRGFQRIRLEVEENNLYAISLYEKQGFVLSEKIGTKYFMVLYLKK